jgi:hypothetical protein
LHSEHTSDPSRRDAVGAALERLVFRELFEFRFMQTDPNLANYLLEPDDRIALLDLGSVREFPAELSLRYARDDRRRSRRAARRRRGDRLPARIRARVDVNALVQPLISGQPGGSRIA